MSIFQSLPFNLHENLHHPKNQLQGVKNCKAGQNLPGISLPFFLPAPAQPQYSQKSAASTLWSISHEPGEQEFEPLFAFPDIHMNYLLKSHHSRGNKPDLKLC